MGWNKDHGTAAKVNAEYAKEQGNVAKQEATNLSQLKTDVEAATQNASTAADNANAIIKDANIAASNADDAASEAFTQANHAKNEGNRAKAEADRLAGTDVSKLDNKIGSLSSLNTTNKTSVVASVNEVATQLAQTENVLKNQESVLNFENSVVGGDWSFALMSAHDALPDSGGVIIVPTTITIKNPVVFTKKIHLKGIDFSHSINFLNTSRIIKDGAFDGITISGYSSFIENITIDGATGNTGDGIVITTSRVGMRNVSVMRQGNDGIRMGKKASDNLNGWNFSNIFAIANGRDGLHFNHETENLIPDLTAGILNGADTRDNGRDGLHVGKTLSNSFFGVMAQHNGRHGVYVSPAARGNHFYNPYTESSGAGPNDEFHLDEGSIQNYVMGQRAGLAYNSIVNNSTSNLIVGSNPQITGNPYYAQSGYHADKFVIGNRELSGSWEIANESSRNLHFMLKGTSANGRFIFWQADKTQVAEFDSLAFRNTGKPINGIFAMHATVAIPSIPAHSSIDITRTVNGINQYSQVSVHPIGGLQSGLIWSAYPAENSIIMRVANITNTASTAESKPIRFSGLVLGA